MKAIFLTLSIILSLSVAAAAPLRKPSPAQIKKLILNNPKANLSIVGFSSLKDCKSLRINSLNILKIGRASSNYYKKSGNYIGTSFKVKLKMKGSCHIEKPIDISNVYGEKLSRTPEYAYREIKGTLPIRSIPLEVTIHTDSYGDWQASEITVFDHTKNSFFSDSTEAYIRNLYARRHKDAPTVDDYKKEQALAKTKLSFAAEAGWGQMQQDPLYYKLDADGKRSSKELLDSQPQNVREEIGRIYFKIGMNRSKRSQFLRKTIALLRAREAKSNNSGSRATGSSSNNRHSHGGRIHSHKLPRQGKAHRHGNGALGR